MDWGWLSDGSFEVGTLDNATLQAVLDFQNFYNENYGGNLATVNPDMNTIEPDTLSVLMNEDGDTYVNPNA